MRFEGKSVVVTGASSGMGRQIAYDFAREGATVVAVARREERLAELAAQAQADGLPGKILPYVGDVSSREANDGMIDYAVEQCGKLDILVNNAGIMDSRPSATSPTSAGTRSSPSTSRAPCTPCARPSR